MAEDLPFHRLTKTERQYLLKVHRGYTSRDIALERGVRSDSVDKVLRLARRKLGDFDRHVLATLLIAAEARPADGTPGGGQPEQIPPAQSLGVQSTKIDQTPKMVSFSAPTQPDDSRSNSPPRDAVTKLLDLTDGAILRRLLLGARRSPTNDLEPWSRFFIISVVAACAACAAVAIVPLLMDIARVAARL